MLQDVFLSKFMATHPTRFYYGTRGKTGVGADLFDLRSTMDALALDHEVDMIRVSELIADIDDFAVAGFTGQKVYHPGVPVGYEKANKVWSAYVPAEDLTITAVLPGALGNKISIKFLRDAADAVSVFGSTVVLTIDNDGATQPSHLQTLIDADPALKGLIKITSTADTAFPDAWVIARAAEAAVFLAGGTGRGMGYLLVNKWIDNNNLLFVAKPSGEDYEVAFATGAALAVSATRRRCTITYREGVTTAAQALAAVLAVPIAMEHFERVATTAGGAGALTGLNGKVSKLSCDLSSSLFAGYVKMVITDVAANEVTFDTGGAVGAPAGGAIGLSLRLGMQLLGRLTLVTV
jgi:hypothetical protein